MPIPPLDSDDDDDEVPVKETIKRLSRAVVCVTVQCVKESTWKDGRPPGPHRIHDSPKLCLLYLKIWFEVLVSLGGFKQLVGFSDSSKNRRSVF